MLRLRILIAFSFCAMVANVAADAPDTHALWLVRHAEKSAEGGKDPELTEAGMRRAGNLARWLEDKNIQAIWSSDYRRTRDTASPLADKLGLAVGIYDPRDKQDMAEKLLVNGANALVTGHSNTIPALAASLCDCEVPSIGESDYDQLYYIVVIAGQAGLVILDQETLFGGSQNHKR